MYPTRPGSMKPDQTARGPALPSCTVVIVQGPGFGVWGLGLMVEGGRCGGEVKVDTSTPPTITCPVEWGGTFLWGSGGPPINNSVHMGRVAWGGDILCLLQGSHAKLQV